MSKRECLATIPKQLEEILQRQGMLTADVLVYAKADMDVSCDFRRQVFVLLKSGLIHGVGQEPTKMRVTGGFVEDEPDYATFSYQFYRLEELAEPGIDSLVVGGVWRVKINGTEQPLCAFTNAYRGRIQRLNELLCLLIKQEVIPEDKLYEEKREEFCPKCGTLYPDQARKVCPKCMDKRKIFFRLGSYFKPYTFGIVMICILAILGSFLTALWPTLSGSILYDEILAGQKETAMLKAIPIGDFAILLLLLAITMLVVKLVQQFFGIWQGRLVSEIVPEVVATLRKKVFASIQSLSVSFFTGKQTGGLMSRVSNDAEMVSNIFIDGIPFILPNLFTILFSCYFMFRENWILAITAIAALPPVIIISVFLDPVLWHYNSKRFQTMRDLRSKLNDNLTGARVIRAFGKEQNEAERLSIANARVSSAQFGRVRFHLKYTVLYHIAKNLSAILTWTVGACFVLAIFRPQMTYGTLLTFTGYVSLLAGPVDFFSYIFQWWSDSMNSAQRIFEILDAQPEVIEAPEPVSLPTVEGEIRLEEVSFGYEENREVLTNITVTVKPGEMLGIVGKSGAGKSTLANLITRLYDPTHGNIYLDGINIRDMSFDALRRSIALVSQETYIFKGTVYDNIAYADPTADRKRVLEAAIAASAHDFICKMPDGYDTQVGTGGRSLSGGERQRISIARAILANPKILILDEATAAVDTETERNIQRALQKLIKNRTTLSIAHRLSTLRDADFLIVLEDGKIAEQGTHDTLVRQKGAYYKLLQIQSKALAMRGIGD